MKAAALYVATHQMSGIFLEFLASVYYIIMNQQYQFIYTDKYANNKKFCTYILFTKN